MELETLASDIEDLTMEATVDATTSAESATEDVISVTLEAEKILEEKYDALQDIIIAAPVMRASGYTSFQATEDPIFTVSFNNQELRVLFPEDQVEYLVERDGYLINLSSSNITGVVLGNSDSLSMQTYHSQYLTLVPFTSTSGNTNAYRYGAFSYLTTYYTYSSTQLQSQTEYGNITVTQKPALFRGFSSFQLIIMGCAVLLVLTNFFGGIFRR